MRGWCLVSNQSHLAPLTSAVRAAISDSCVISVTDHVAGYFDELGITITVKPETPDDQVRMVKEKITPALFGSRQQVKWVVIFQRGGKQIGVLFPDGLFALE